MPMIGEFQLLLVLWHCYVIFRLIVVASNNLKRIVPIFEFYNTMADFIDLPADYDSWQSVGR